MYVCIYIGAAGMTAPLQLLGGGWPDCTLCSQTPPRLLAQQVASGKHCHAGRIIIQVYLMLLNSRRYKCIKGIVPFSVARSPPAVSQDGDASGGFSKQHLSNTIRQGGESLNSAHVNAMRFCASSLQSLFRCVSMKHTFILPSKNHSKEKKRLLLC